jgi:hypothetical protein
LTERNLRRSARWCGAAGLIALSAGCGLGRGREARPEAAVIVQAVRALRDAPNAEKGALVPPLAAASCSSPDVCALRDACLAAYRAHVGALAEQDAIARALTAGSPPADASARLDSIEQRLEAAATGARDCAAREVAVRTRYRL